MRLNHPSAPLLWPTLCCSGFFFAGMVRVVGCMKSVLTVCVWTMWLPTDLLKNKSRPEHAANEAVAWVESERAMREKLKKEREARERFWAERRAKENEEHERIQIKYRRRRKEDKFTLE